VAQWITRLLEVHGCQTAAIESVEELSRVVSFIDFDAVVAWLPRREVLALTNLVARFGFSKPIIFLSWVPGPDARAVHGAGHVVVPLPMTGQDLLQALVENVPCHQVSRGRGC
jgi:hypothetical protein